MPTILLLTTDNLPLYDLETTPIAEALERRGVQTKVANWADSRLAEYGADLALIRSTWDYTAHLDDFLTVLERLPMPVLNPFQVVRWNSHKRYLAELGAAGVPIVPTTVVPRRSNGGLPSVDAEHVVVKPAVSAGAVGVGLFRAGSAAAAQHLATLVADSDVLVQPFQESVRDGERSLIHIAGHYSHAIRKTPADGEFRVQEEHGGQNVAHTATAAEVAVAEQALAAVAGSSGLVYARTDLVGPAAAPMVMELELIEPELYLRLAPGSLDRLADAVLARLG